MPAPPLAVAVPAAAAGLAYLSARASIPNDVRLLSSAAPAALHLLYRTRFDRLNQFYRLEQWATASASAERPFVLFEGRQWTYAQVYDAALRCGAWLRRARGVRPRDVVAVDFQNSDLFVVVWMALWSIGAKPAFINHHLTGEALAHCVGAAKTKLLLVDPNVAHLVVGGAGGEEGGGDVRGRLPGVEVVVWSADVQAEVAAEEPVRAPDADRSEDLGENLALLVYTSGTTGLPKAAIVSLAKCVFAAQYTARWLGRGPESILYTSMPLYHSSAALLGLLSTLESGSTIALGRKFSVRDFWPEVRASRATIIQYVGETCRYLLAAPPQTDPATGEDLDRRHDVKVAFGNGLRPDVWDRFKERFGIEAVAEFYAATEGTFGLWNMSRNDLSRGAVGRFGWLYNAIVSFSSSINAAVVEVDFAADQPRRDPATGFCTRVRPGEPGEMIFKLPPKDVAKRFQGYYGNPKATSSKVLRDVFRKGDAYFRSGDVVRWTADGLVYFHDRIGDTFRWKSENVSTAEVSHALGLHPAVVEANVYGVELPGHDGRAGCAAVVLEPGPPGDALLADLAAHAARELPRYAVPLFLRLLPRTGMQTTGTNKQQKHELRQQGVDPASCAPHPVYWLKGGTYVPFQGRDLAEMRGGKVKL